MCLALCQNKFAVLVRVTYFVQDAKLSAGELLAGWSFGILSKINNKWTKMSNLLDFVALMIDMFVSLKVNS